jgi:hypothetical protein
MKSKITSEMIDPDKDISNLDFPVSHVIREALRDLPEERRQEVLGPMNEDDFIIHRVDIYLKDLETAMHTGYDELGANEIALKECLAGLVEA